LYSLSLEGSPGADTLPVTGEVWVRDLWDSRRRYWMEDGDVQCIRQAFATLRQTCTRWPTPAKFWDALPPRPHGEQKLLGPGWGREREAEALACMREWCKDRGFTTAGDRIQ
jgi:hypothetical protein